MPTLDINIEPNTFKKESDGSISVRISSKANNGLSINSSGEIVATKGKDGNPGSGGSINLPGNSIAGTHNVGISVIRCNRNVSRRTPGATEEEGYRMVNVSNFTVASTIVGKIRAFIGG